MKQLLATAVLLLVLVGDAGAAGPYYVRVGGSDSTNCTGLADVDYDGSGTGEACAFSHPAYPLGAVGTTRILGANETLIIGPGSYMIGCGMPNNTCDNNAPYDSKLDVLPNGAKIYGAGYLTGDNTAPSAKPQLWGTKSVEWILNVDGTSDVDIQFLDLTDHSECGFRVGGNQCDESYPITQTYGRTGIYGFGGSNLNLRNLDIHGLSNFGINIGGFNGYTRTYVNVWGNSFGNVDGDRAGHSNTSFSGTISITNSRNYYAGCAEAYPPSASFDHADYDDCTDQNASGYGDGEGTYQTGGNWVIKNSDWSWNVSDGLDLLYHISGNVSIDKSRFEGNTGNSVKVVATNLDITNSAFVGNCTYLSDVGKVFNTGSFSDCRANGSVLITPMLNSVINFFNNTVVSAISSSGSPGIETSSNTGAGIDTSTATGTEDWYFSNNIFYSPNATWTLYYSGFGAGFSASATALANASTDHTIIYNFQSNPCPSGTGNQCNTNPLFISTPSATATNNISTRIYLQSGSPARGAGASGNSFWNTASDNNGFGPNSPVDIGAIQYGSTPSGGGGGGSSTGINAYITGKASLTGGRIQ